MRIDWKKSYNHIKDEINTEIRAVPKTNNTQKNNNHLKLYSKTNRKSYNWTGAKDH